MNSLFLFRYGDRIPLEFVAFKGELLETAVNPQLSLKVGEIATCEMDDHCYECRLIQVTEESYFFFIPKSQMDRGDPLRQHPRFFTPMNAILINGDHVYRVQLVDLSSQGVGFTLYENLDINVGQQYFITIEHEATQPFYFYIQIMNYSPESNRYGACIDNIDSCQAQRVKQLVFQALLAPS